MKTYLEIRSELHRLKKIIESTDKDSLPKQPDWGGADVIITREVTDSHREWLGTQPIVVSFQNTEPRRRLIVTSFHQELSWLFIQMRDLFSGHLDYITKFDFYGSLAENAIQVKKRDSKQILFAVIDAALVYLECMNKSEMFDKD
jgi:hypothetical protein